jgi:small-conductance mechanosensitive channel
MHRLKHPAAIFFIITLLCLQSALLAQTTPPPSDAQAPGSEPIEASDPGEASDPSKASDPGEVSDPKAEPGTETALEQLWRDRTADLDRFASEAEGIMNNSLNDSVAFNIELDRNENEFGRLQRLFQISRGHPAEQEDILSQMVGLRTNLAARLEPFQTLLTGISRRLDEVKAIQKSMLDQADVGDALETNYNNNLSIALKRLDLAKKGLDSIIDPANSSLERLDGSIKQIEAEIPQTWKDYYFGGTGLGGLGQTTQELFKWGSSFSSRTLFMYPQSSESWSNSILKFVIAAAIMVLLAYLILKEKIRLPHPWNVELVKIIKGPWIWMAIGLSFLSASSSNLGGSYLFLKLFGILTLIWGIGSLSWKLRVIAAPKLEGSSSPLDRFYHPAALGVALLYVDMPDGTVTVIWVLTQVAFLYFLRRYKSKINLESSQMPLPERLAYGSAIYFAITSLAVAIFFGYSRLAILVFMGLYALVNIIILGSALAILAAIICRQIFNPEIRPVKHAIIHSLVVPVSFLLSLVSALPWLLAVPGTVYLLKSLLTKGYTIGDASFEFSRIVFIIMLFLLFRSLRGLGVTSLAHLPDTMPHVERGVIPPLQTLFTYLLWALFATISLSMLGVNFTSLAVILGGLSVGIGLGLQNLFNNLVSGFALIFGQSVLVGDSIDVGGVTGIVRSVNIRCTVVETSENALVFIPNSSIVSGQFINWTRNNTFTRKRLDFLTVYGTDISLAISLLKQAASVNEGILEVPEPSAALGELNDKAMVFNLWATVREYSKAAAILSKLREDVYRLFRENGIEFYKQTLDVYLEKKPELLER